MEWVKSMQFMVSSNLVRLFSPSIFMDFGFLLLLALADVVAIRKGRFTVGIPAWNALSAPTARYRGLVSEGGHIGEGGVAGEFIASWK